MNKNHKEKSKYIFELKIFFLNQGSYEDWKVFSRSMKSIEKYLLCPFLLWKMQVISILGLAPYYIASRIFAQKKT